MQNKDVRTQIATQQAIKFNGGGHINHSLFWKNLAPTSQGGGQLQDGPLKQAIDKDFGSFDKFQAKFKASALGIQGSGWAWLGYANGRLDVIQAKDQDPLITHYPILGLDMWEHAFYLQFLNDKASYVDSVWKVYNWKEAEKRFQEAQQKASL